MKPLCTILLLFLFFFGNAQEMKEFQFPQDFFGHYKGTLKITSTTQLQQIPMQFNLLPTETKGLYSYQLIYGEGEAKQLRDYLLRVKDAEKGIYEVDEQNGILLENRVIDNKMYTLFEVEGSLLTTFITFQDDHLVFEIVFSDTEKKQTSGGQETDIPEVISYPIKVVQKAYLIKQ